MSQATGTDVYKNKPPLLSVLFFIKSVTTANVISLTWLDFSYGVITSIYPRIPLPIHGKLALNHLYKKDEPASPKNAYLKLAFPTVTSVGRIVMNGDYHKKGDTATRKLAEEKTHVFITAEEQLAIIDEVVGWFMIQGGPPWTLESGWEWNPANLGPRVF